MPVAIYEVLKYIRMRVMLADYVGFKVFEERLFERRLKELEDVIKKLTMVEGDSHERDKPGFVEDRPCWIYFKCISCISNFIKHSIQRIQHEGSSTEGEDIERAGG